MPDENRSQQVSLGCGTLILIALIVMLSSNRGTGDVEREVRRLRSEVQSLRTAVETQTTEIKLLREKLGAQPGMPGAAGR